VAIVHIVVLSSSFVTLLGAVTAVRRADDQSRRRAAWSRRCAEDNRAYRALDRAMGAAARPVASLHHLDQITDDLRRLHHQRGVSQWLDRAYDKKLCLACECLGLTEHLEPLEGLDREIERLRVEHVLAANGLDFRP
jgi:hypothetical protein